MLSKVLRPSGTKRQLGIRQRVAAALLYWAETSVWSPAGLAGAAGQRRHGYRLLGCDALSLDHADLQPFRPRKMSSEHNTVAQVSHAICDILATNVGIMRKARREGRRTKRSPRQKDRDRQYSIVRKYLALSPLTSASLRQSPEDAPSNMGRQAHVSPLSMPVAMQVTRMARPTCVSVTAPNMRQGFWEAA